jgi:uncharacterized protein
VEDTGLIYSEHCRSVSGDERTVKVQIYSTGHEDWVLEVVDEFGNSTVWDDLFETDAEAYEEFKRTLAEEGIESLIGLPG